MAWIIEQRRPTSALPYVRDWSECAGTYCVYLADIDVDWWVNYDERYCLEGWEYRTRQVKDRKKENPA